MADGGDVKLGDLLKVGRSTAIEADPMAAESVAFRTTYIAKRPMFCGSVYRTQYGDKVTCTREVERLPSGLPTGRCADCREREMTATQQRRHEAKRAELAEANAKRFEGTKRRSPLKIVEDE